ncbi:MAG: aldo/keto reductase [Eubacteriales bacterium]
MKTLTVCTYPLPLSRICLGTASMGGNGLTGEPLERAFVLLDTYYALGGRFLDTANVYGRWGADHTNASEKVIGRWLKERRISDMTVTTKACHYALETPSVSRVDRASLLCDVEESRAALGLDRLHLLLLHRDNEETDIRTIVDFCVPLVDEGKVVRFGFSNFRADRVKAALAYLGADWNRYFAGVSNEWSLAMDGVEGYAPGSGMVAADDALRSVQAEYGFPLFPYSSLAHGFFAKLKRCGAVYDGVWRNTDGFTGSRAWLTDRNGIAYNRLLARSAETGCSVSALSLAYLLSHPSTIPVLSVSRPEQLEELKELDEWFHTPDHSCTLPQ